MTNLENSTKLKNQKLSKKIEKELNEYVKYISHIWDLVEKYNNSVDDEFKFIEKYISIAYDQERDVLEDYLYNDDILNLKVRHWDNDNNYEFVNWAWVEYDGYEWQDWKVYDEDIYEDIEKEYGTFRPVIMYNLKGKNYFYLYDDPIDTTWGEINKTQLPELVSVEEIFDNFAVMVENNEFKNVLLQNSFIGDNFTNYGSTDVLSTYKVENIEKLLKVAKRIENKW